MQDREKLLKVYFRPKLKSPVLIAGGLGTANIGLRVVSYLREKLSAELFAEIEPGDFFTPPYGFTFQEGLIQVVPLKFAEQAPQNKFYWKSGREHDLIFYMGNDQPLPGKVPELADYVLEIAQSFNVNRMFTPGAFITEMHHLSEPAIRGVASTPDLLKYLDSYNIMPSPPMNIAYNLVAWLLGAAKKRGIEAIGLISEIPFYNAEGGNVRARRALIRTLLQMLELEQLDLTDLDYMLLEEERQIEQKLEELRGSTDEKAAEFIRYIEQLERQSEGKIIGQSAWFPTQEELPESLRYIEGLYIRAKQDHSRVPELKAEVDRLESFNRLMLLRKYGDELLRLLGGQM